jgi:hypothetical protein
MGLEAFAFILAGIMALYFQKKNTEADKYDVTLEGVSGFRYTT